MYCLQKPIISHSAQVRLSLSLRMMSKNALINQVSQKGINENLLEGKTTRVNQAKILIIIPGCRTLSALAQRLFHLFVDGITTSE